MKKPFTLFIISLALTTCVSKTKITGSWVNPKLSDKTYTSMFITVLSGNHLAKSTVESYIGDALRQSGVKVVKKHGRISTNVP